MEDINRKPGIDYIKQYVQEIRRYQKQIDQVPDTMKVKLISLKSKQLYFIGELAAEFGRQHKLIRAARKQTYWEVYLETTKGNKQAAAELATNSLRETEAEYYGYWRKYNNAITTVKEEVNALKYEVRQEIADGNRQN